MPRLLLIRGIPGSGKSTFADSLVPFGFEHFEADQYFMRNGFYDYDPTQVYSAHKWCQRETEAALKAGKSVVVANTFTARKELKPYFEIARRYGIVPEALTMSAGYESVHDVPQEKIDKMRSRFKHDLSDMYEEYYG